MVSSVWFIILKMRLDNGFKGRILKDSSVRLHDPDVCVPYRNTSSNATASKRDNVVPVNLSYT